MSKASPLKHKEGNTDAHKVSGGYFGEKKYHEKKDEEAEGEGLIVKASPSEQARLDDAREKAVKEVVEEKGGTNESKLYVPKFNYQSFENENNITPTVFTGEKGVFNLDEANQIWTDENGDIVDDADVPEEYIKKNKKKLEASIQVKGKKFLTNDGGETAEFYLPKYERTGGKGEGGIADNTAIQNAHAFKATDEQIESSTEFASKSITKVLEQNSEYNQTKRQQGDIDNQWSQLEARKPTAGNRKAMATWKREKLFLEQEKEKLENLKIERDKNPLWKYIEKANKKLKKGKAEDYNKENLIAEAKALYVQDQQAKHLQKNIKAWINEQDGFGVDMPGSQKDEIAKIETAVKDLTDKQKLNLQEVTANKTLYEGINSQMELLLHGGKNKKGEEVKGFNNREVYFKEKLKTVKEQLAVLGPVIKTGPLAWTEATYEKYNSIIEENKELLNDYKQYQIGKEKFLTKFDELEVIRDAHYQNYLQGITKGQEFGEDGQDLLAYQNIMTRNQHIAPAIANWAIASGTSIASGLEDTAAEIIMLPQGLRNDRMFKDNPLAQILVNKADKFEKARGGQPILDNEGNYIGETKGYKDNINKFIQSLHNGVQLPQLWEDCDSIEDYGKWSVNAFANFLPQMALMYAAPSASLKILATSAAGSSLAHSRRSNYMGETDYSLGQRLVHGLMCGTAEYYSEKVTLGLMKSAPKIVKERFKNGFASGIKNTLKPKSLLTSGYRSGTEGLSEVGAAVFGQNAADRLAFGKNVSLWRDVPESFASGLVMERTMSMSALAGATMQPFQGNRYDSKLKGFEKEKQDVLIDLSQEGLSESNQNDLIQKYIRIQNKQDALLQKQYENVDMMRTEEVESLIDLDVKINELNQSIENIQEDDSLSDADKDIRIRKVKQERSELETERNKIVEEYEKDETRQKRVEEYEKQKQIVKAKLDKENKRRKENSVFAEAMGGVVTQGEMKEFETAEEQREFFEKQTSEDNDADRAVIKEMQDLLKDPNTSRGDRIAIQNSLAFLRKQIDARKKYAKAASSEYGFIGQKKDGSFTIYLNKENATKLGGNVNVAAHEFLHSVLYQTTKGDSKLQSQLGDAVIDFIREKKGGFSSKFIEKMEPYQGEQNFGEEIITVMSESILDGSLKYKEGFFTKVGDIIRQNLQRLGLKDIKFDTGKDVYNFIKDYNASIEKNYDSKAIDRMMATGAQGKLLEGRKGGRDIMQSSKEQSQKVQDIYAKKGADGAAEIAMEYTGMAEKIFERNLNNAPSEDIRNNLLSNKDIITADLLYNPGTKTAKARTVLGLVKDFETKKHKYGNVAAYINQFLPERAKEIFAPYGVEMAITKSQEQEGIREKVAKIAAAETKKLSEDSFKGHKIHEKLGKGDVRVRKLVEDYQREVKALAKKMPIEEVRNLKFQDVQGMGHKIIAEIMGIDAAKLDPSNTKQYHANLRKDDKRGTNEQLSAQMVISKNPLSFKIAIPKHHTTKLVKDKKTGEMVERPHQAIGIPGSILNPYFIKGKRKDNLTPWTLDKEMMDDKKFLEPIGRIDGKSFRNDKRKSQQVILNFATLLDKTMTYQAIKEQKLEEGYTLDDTKTMSDGVSEFSFSKAVRNLTAKHTEIFYRKLPELAASVNPALKDYTKIEAMKIAIEEVYGEELLTKDKTAIAKDFVGLIKKYQNVIANNQTVNEAVWVEYLAETFNQEADNIIKMLNLQIGGKPVRYATGIYNNQQNIERGRRIQVVGFGNHLVKQGKSHEEVARIMAILKPMFAGNSKIGKGMFVTDVNGKIQEISYNQLVYPKTHKTKAGQVRTEFGSPRNQIFESVEAFEEWGVMQIDGMTPEIWKNADTKLIAQTSQAAMKDRDFNGRLAEAKEARQVIDDMMTFLNKEGNDLDVAMFMISNLSNMDAPLRRAANLQYIADAVLGMKNIGKNAEYEHMIPANYMALKIIDQYKNKGGIKNQDDFYKNYNVAIIPKTMDNVLKLQGLQSKMMPGYNFEIDPSTGRYYNFLTKGFEDIVSIRDINTNQVIGPLQFSKKAAKVKTFSNAVQFSRSANNLTKGITVLDFDDTLATTKSGVRAKIPNADGLPKPQRKVIFLAGGAGSGKSNVVSKLRLEDQGFKIVNSDISLEWLKKNNGLPENMNDLTKEQRSKLGSLQHQARGIAKRKMVKYKGDGNGVVVDGTGGSIKSMQNLVDQFKSDGYDVSMMFVETSLPVALERNAARKERSLLNKIVEKNHESVQGNKDGFKTMFGNRFMEVNTDNLSQEDAMPTKLTKQMDDFVSGYENRRLDAEEFASEGADILDQGGTFDFSEFNKVVEGQTAPLFNKAMKLQDKFGNKDMFVLTARPAESAPAIFEFLQANGLNIPLKNITGLANSTPEAKALWMAEKVGDGYNDFYFADDALQNVQAVQNMLDQFDVKSKVQQAKIQFSKSMNDQFNDILEDVTGIESKKRFSAIKGRKRGAGKGKFRFFIPPSHEDFVGLLYNFLGKGREGDAHRDFFEQALIRPLNRANRELDTARQSVANDYKELNKKFPEVKSKFAKKTPDGDFTFQDAVRVYLWNKHGHKIPGLTETDQTKLAELVQSDPQLQTYAEALNVISKQETYVNPTEGWNSGDIRMDLDDATGRIGRKQFFAEFIENADVIFSEENLNKIEAGYGKGVRESLEDMLYRIETGRNRPTGQNEQVNKLMNYLNGSVGTVMFFNMRSALLQQMSIVNYINFADNNVLAAAKAFANQKQYWADWAFIFNSDMLRQRRGGIQTDVNGAELAASLRNSKDVTRKLISKLLELGFLPTQIGDNIAIATGGATYYRNRINTYIKQGMSQKEAEAAAFTDFQNTTQSTQQSARPDMVSKQQASVIGKVILNFQNVTSQFNRLGKKAFQDIYNRRITKPNTTQMQSDISNAARITYYFAVQNAIFYTLQTALFAMMFDDDEEDVNNLFLKKRERLINGSIDSVLRGSGLIGGVVATLKNVAIAYARQRDVRYNPDESAVLLEALNLSPVIGIKARKITNAEKTLNYNKSVIKEMETFDIDNPQWSAVTNYTEAFTNIPVNRLYNKTQNIRQALNNDHAAWERTLMVLGWSQYNLNLENKKMEEIKEDIKEKKKIESKEKAKIKKEEKKKQQKEENKVVIEENKKKSKKDGVCSAISKGGNRCKTKVVEGKLFCTVHEKAEQNETGTKSQCKKIKDGGKRCKMQTSSKSGYCYYHD